MGPEPLHPHVCGPHVALEVGDQPLHPHVIGDYTPAYHMQ
jgi:hypothetical protein